MQPRTSMLPISLSLNMLAILPLICSKMRTVKGQERKGQIPKVGQGQCFGLKSVKSFQEIENDKKLNTVQYVYYTQPKTNNCLLQLFSSGGGGGDRGGKEKGGEGRGERR